MSVELANGEVATITSKKGRAVVTFTPAPLTLSEVQEASEALARKESAGPFTVGGCSLHSEAGTGCEATITVKSIATSENEAEEQEPIGGSLTTTTSVSQEGQQVCVTWGLSEAKACLPPK